AAKQKRETTGAGEVGRASGEARGRAPKMDEMTPPGGGEATTADDAAREPAEESAAPYVSRYSVLAASLALAAALGAMVGALIAYGLARPAALPAIAAGRTALEDIPVLQENVVPARGELAALQPR